MIRWITRALAIAVIVAIALVVLDFAELLVPIDSDGRAAMAPTIPACDGRAVAEGVTYKIRDPERGEIVAIHAARGPDGAVAPDRDADDLVLALRVAAVPGDEIVGRDDSVFVNGIKLDDIETQPFPSVEVGGATARLHVPYRPGVGPPAWSGRLLLIAPSRKLRRERPQRVRADCST